MPPTGRRKTRTKDADHHSEVDAPDTMNTPSRKRRRVTGADSDAKLQHRTSPKRAARRASAESDETIEHQDEPDETSLFAVAEEVIRHLKTATYDVGVAIDHNNNVVQQSAQAFAKIAGRNWTFYVSNLRVVIGRPNLKAKGEGTPGGSANPRPPTSTDMTVDIDLGPDQQVSRVHAEIAYDTEQSRWFIVVNGRNGLTVDDRRLDRGQRMFLRSGNVINCLGTQMMFMLPDEPPVIHHDIRSTLLPEGEQEDEEDAHDDEEACAVPRGSGRGRGGNAFQSSSQGRPVGGGTGRAPNQLVAPASFQQQQQQPQPGTPVARHREQPQPKSRPSPAYARGLIVDNGEEIDYSADGSRDIKPPHSYAQMIGQAILSTPEENSTLNKIYEFIKEKYAFFRFGGGGWQNSIRHNLSLSKHFEKIPRRTDEPGKGMKWQIVPEHRAEYMKKNFHDSRRAPRRVGSSGPDSPAGYMAPTAQTERLMDAMASGGASASNFKTSPGSSTPPPLTSSYPAQTESFTPDRGPQTANFPATNGNSRQSVSAHSTPFQFRAALSQQHNVPIAGPSTNGVAGEVDEAATDSPVTLTCHHYDGSGAGHMFTPMVARHPVHAGVMSTQKPPSFYAKELFSSPAPFWKYVDIAGSTPAKPPIFEDMSPEKMGRAEGDEPTDEDVENEDEEMEDDDEGGDEKEVNEEEVNNEDVGEKEGDEQEDNEKGDEKEEEDVQLESEMAHPSSPPLLHAGGASSGGEGPDESPSRTISRPVSRREALGKKSLEPIPSFPAPAPKLNLNPAIAGPAYNPYAVTPNDDEEEEGFDLQKGFQKIGTYHRTMQTASSATH
ncbi:hypothetical protein EJ08DRAFT_694862 [Tothia fuscella]|uniref:Uncharacterized protein n=1 Tax=Tothia fuscella TaxID=1048955 RepID=A0A9P4NX10_9PEZI|nr:hypothetical protein EJ08DRAFT_694862 [Tothia fuscella]